MRGSDSNGEKNNDLLDDSCSETFSQTIHFKNTKHPSPKDFVGEDETVIRKISFRQVER
jgi:hypothetical protein